MKGWLLILLFAAGCTPQYTREQGKNCDAAESAVITFLGSVAQDSPAHTRETALAALPAYIDRLKSYPPGSAGADEEIKGLINGAIYLQSRLPHLGDNATGDEVEALFEGLAHGRNAIGQRCLEIHQRLAAPSVPSPAPFPAGWASPSVRHAISPA
jgi:hypothetical protein